ncbi:helix-turn-helix domain-containing protein [Bacillus mycoides]|uniref:helix-turn-helix domain-containing protein n=1 Tax=Bacillus mycoides TaxID=1405 RepID=UPI003D6563B9
MRKKVKDKYQVLLNRGNFNRHLAAKDLNITKLVEKLGEEGIFISYTTLTNLVYNANTWKLTYAVMICKILDLEIFDIFDIVETEEE